MATEAEITKAYNDGRLNPEQREAYEELVRRGEIGGVRQTSQPKAFDPMREAAAIATGANAGIANVLGLPGELVEQGGRALGFDMPEIGVEAVENLMGRAGIRTDDPTQSTVGRYAQSAMRDVGGMAATAGMGGLIPRAAQGGAALVRQAATSEPVRQVMSALGAGAGQEAAVDILGEGPAQRFVGGLLGGTVPLAGEYAARSAANAVSPFTSGGQEVIAGNTLRRFATDPDAVAMPEQSRVPGVRRTTAEATADPGLAQLERTLITEDPRQGGRLGQRQAANNLYRRIAIGGDPGAATDVADLATRRVSTMEQLTADRVEAAMARAQARADALGPGATPEVAGQIIREEFDDALTNARAATGRAYRAIDPDGTSSIPVGEAYADVAGLVNERLGDFAPDDLVNVVNRLRADEMSFDQMERLARRAASISGKASVQGDRNLSQVAREVSDRIRQTADSAAQRGEGFTPEQVAQYNVARETRREQGRRFEQGPSRAVGATRPYGEPTLSAGEVPAQYWNTSKGGADDAAQFIQAVGDRPRAVEALTDYAVNDLVNYAGKADGTLDAKKLSRWLGRNRGPLKEFPELQREMTSVMKAQQLVDRLDARRTRAIADVRKGPLGAFLKADPDRAIDGILRSRDRTRELARLAQTARKEEDGIEALRQAVLDNILRRSEASGQVTALGDTGLSPAAFRRTLDDLEPALKNSGLFPGTHLKQLRDIYDDMDRVIQAATSGRAVGSPTQQNLSLATLLTQMSLGLIDPDSPVAAALLRPMSFIYRVPDDQVRALLVDAALDPKLAANLAGRATPERMNALAQILPRRLAQLTGTTGTQATMEGTERQRATATGR